MKAEDIFGIILRTFGVILLFAAVNELIDSIIVSTNSRNMAFIKMFLQRKLPILAAGIFLTFYADMLTRLVYRNKQ